MNELLKLLLLFGLGSVAGFINVMAGGGSTITLPVLSFLGLDWAMANGTNRIGILVQNLSAVMSFHKKKYHKFKLSLKLAAFTLPGALAGAIIATKISDELFQNILAYILIGVAISMFLRRLNQKKNQRREAAPEFLAHLSCNVCYRILRWVYPSRGWIHFHGNTLSLDETRPYLC